MLLWLVNQQGILQRTIKDHHCHSCKGLHLTGSFIAPKHRLNHLLNCYRPMYKTVNLLINDLLKQDTVTLCHHSLFAKASNTTIAQC